LSGRRRARRGGCRAWGSTSSTPKPSLTRFCDCVVISRNCVVIFIDCVVIFIDCVVIFIDCVVIFIDCVVIFFVFSTPTTSLTRLRPATYCIIYRFVLYTKVRCRFVLFRDGKAGFAPEIMRTDVGFDVQHAQTKPDQVRARHLLDYIFIFIIFLLDRSGCGGR